MDLRRTGTLAGLLLALICTACSPSVSAPIPSAGPENTSPPDPAATDLTAPAPLTEESASPTPDAPLAALVNGQPIYLERYERALRQYEADLPVQGIDPNSPEGQADLAGARRWILEWMVEDVLIEQAAAAAGVAISDAEVEAHMQEIIAENGGEEAFLAELANRGETYEDAWQRDRTDLIVMAMTQRISEGVPEEAEHIHARHILVDTQEEAERILAQLQAGADFAGLASAYSQDPNTKEIGGDLDWFPRGVLTVPEVEEAVFALQPGQFSGVVPSLLGYHIVQVVERDPARPVSPENLDLLRARVLKEWVEGLWAQADIQYFVETSP